jgi:hypothetical protein
MTDIQICNLALARLGDSRITALTDATAQAQFCTLFYTQTVEELQAEFDWQFCRKQVNLTSGTAPLTGYSTQYALPADFIRAIRLGNIDASENFGTWEIVGTNLHTNLTSSVALDYIANITTTTSFPAIFTELLSIKLAAVLAMPLTGSKDLFTQLAEVYGATLQKPAFLHATERVGRQRATNSITTQADIVRLAILKTGTADGYKPNGQAAMLGNSFFDQARNELLSEFDWSFARTSASITADAANPVTGYAKRYALPAGALSVLRVNEIDASENFSVWEVVGGFIHTEAASPILAEFTTTVTDITRFPAIFIDLLVNKIAMRLAMTTGDAGRMEILAKETEFIFQKPGFSKAIEKIAPIRPSVALSATEICKQAVMRLGTTDSLSQTGGHPALFAHSFYEHALEELLADLPWAFAKKQVSIAANATAPTQGYLRRYAIPTDFLQLIRVNQIDTSENFGQWEIVGGFIHTDLGSPIIIDYTANITDVTQFPPPFVEALIARIAAKIALPLTAKPDIATALAQAAAETLNRPTIQILIEKSAKPRAGSAANSVSEICRQAILKVGSAEAFKPYGEPMAIATSLFDQTRNELLADFDWQFARVQSSLTADGTPPAFGYTTRYALPSATLKVLRVNGVDEDENFGNWEIVGGFLHTYFNSAIRIETTAIVSDATKFPPVFVNMLTVTLAMKLSQLMDFQAAPAAR